jgi:hypothetical protein
MLPAVTPTAPSRLWPLGAAAHKFRIPAAWLRHEVIQGRIPAVRTGGTALLFDIVVLERLLLERAAGPTSREPIELVSIPAARKASHIGDVAFNEAIAQAGVQIYVTGGGKYRMAREDDITLAIHQWWERRNAKGAGLRRATQARDRRYAAFLNQTPPTTPDQPQAPSSPATAEGQPMEHTA